MKKTKAVYAKELYAIEFERLGTFYANTKEKRDAFKAFEFELITELDASYRSGAVEWRDATAFYVEHFVFLDGSELEVWHRTENSHIALVAR